MIQGSLENESVKLRAPELSDLDSLYAWENNQEIWKASNTITPFSRFVLKKYIESSHKDIWETKQLRLIIEAKTLNSLMFMPIGVIDLFDFDPFHNRAGVGILIANKEYRQKGYAKEALSIVIRYAFETLQFHQLYCGISSENTVSLQLFKSCGFSVVGVKKEWLKTSNGWVDEVLLQILNPIKIVQKN